MASSSSFFQGDTPHGLMKRIIYKKRLQGFIPKTLQSGYSTIIFDGFSGAGKYGDEWPTEIEKYGSPIIALRVAINYFIKKKKVQHKTFGKPPSKTEEFKVSVKKIKNTMTLNVDSLAKNEVTLYFVEEKGKNFKNLITNVRSVLSCYDLDFSVDYAHDVVTVEVRDERFPVVCHLFWSSFENIPCPTVDDRHYCLAFIDPFGYSLELDKIADFMGPRKDAIFNFMSSYVNRFVRVGQIAVLVGGLFGIDIPQEIREQGKIGKFIEDIVRERPANATQATNVDILVDNFCKQLSQKVGSALNLVFEMKDKGNKQLYHLIFNTHSEKGYKHMKHIMVSCNQDEGFPTKENPKMELSDFRILKNNLELNLSIEQDDNRIAGLIFEKFKGQTVNGKEVEDYVEFETPFVFHKKQLKIIENKTLMTVRDKCDMARRRGTYAHLDEGHIILTFMSELEGAMADLSITGH